MVEAVLTMMVISSKNNSPIVRKANPTVLMLAPTAYDGITPASEHFWSDCLMT